MTYLFRNNPQKKFNGGATLLISIVLLITATLIIVFAANQGILLTRITSNQNQNEQAFEAAEAGLGFGINYLQQNQAIVTGSPAGGYISYSDSNTTNISLANSSRFSVVYTNPTQNNYNLITITSTGTSSDGTSTHVVSEQVQFGSTLNNPSTTALTVLTSVSMTGNATISNTSTNQTITAGQSVSLGGSSETVTSGGVSSTAGNIKSDISQNAPSLDDESVNDFFTQYFGTTQTEVKNDIAHYYSNSSSANYSATLNGMTGTSIWIDQTGGTATINGSTTIGSPTNPVLLIINGALSLSGNVTIYGFVFDIGSPGIDTLTGNTTIIGGMASTGATSMAGNISLSYNSSVLSNLKNQNTMSYFAPVPGSWKDF